MTGDWYAPLRRARSRGSQAARPGSLAGLHAARAAHAGQFFTPDALARVAWRFAEPAMRRAWKRDHARVALIDNSAGSGRLLQFAHPDRHTLTGIDTDAGLLADLGRAAERAGFECEFSAAGMESVRPSGYGVAVLNPPFSLHIEAPTFAPLPCTTRGRFGPDTGATSHVYALEQALEAADLVVAILPAGFEPFEAYRDRLAARVTLPRGCFRDEGTEVDVALLVFGREAGETRNIHLASLDGPIPDLSLECRTTFGTLPRLREHSIEDSGPYITLPVTGDNTVRVVHNGRRIGLKFACGLVQAKVENAVYRSRITGLREAGVRLAKGVRYTGQAALDVEAHLCQADPRASVRALLDMIRGAGGNPAVGAGLERYFERRIRETERRRTPLRHVVQIPRGMASAEHEITATARTDQVLDPSAWGSPFLEGGTRLTFRRDGPHWTAEHAGATITLPKEALYQRFEIAAADAAATPQWTAIHEGRAAAFPALAHAIRRRAARLGVDRWLSWDYQIDDAIELLIAPGASIVAWEMGLGKARLALALVALSECRHGLICVQPHLVDEMVKEIRTLGIADDRWKVIATPADLRQLATINLITYNRLRLPLARTHPKRTYAKALRRRIGTLVADEGHIVRNGQTQQSRALWNVAARHTYIFSGSPIANYPRDILYPMNFTAGDGVASQPYGRHHGYVTAEAIESAVHIRRGVDEFRERHVTTEWVTNEFKEDLLNGAKREIPAIANLESYRDTLAPVVLRRVSAEPEVRRHIQIPEPSFSTRPVDWDDRHLAHYLAVAEEFMCWYKREIDGTHKERRSSLVAILARIKALEIACNSPAQKTKIGAPAYGPLTSKQRFALERLKAFTDEGRKSILYASSPHCLERLGRELDARGVESVILHGGIDIETRTRTLDERFRFGDAPVLLASLGVTQTGLNIHQASRVILYNRSWTATTEQQAIARVLRPQQRRDVQVEHLHIAGSIDEYQAQMCAYKADAARAGLDWGTPGESPDRFLHLDTILGRFVADLEELLGCENRRGLRERLAA